MFALRVTVNDKKTVVAGAEDLSVLSAIVTLTGQLGVRTVPRSRGKPDLFMHLGGLTSRPKDEPDEHLNWIPHGKLKLGDRILIEIVDAEKTSRIVERRTAGGKSSNEREYYKHLKKQYLQLKKKYEPES